MKSKYQEYEKSIKKTHSFGGTPKYEAEIETQLTPIECISIAEKAMQDLDWDVIYINENTLEAKRHEKTLGITRWTEAISVTVEGGKMKVKSVSLGNEIWDTGRNAKRVKLFIFAFRETEKTFDKEQLRKLAAENEAAANWNDYTPPKTLPQPQRAVEANLFVPLAGAIVLSAMLALLVAKISLGGVYVIGLVEFLVGVALGFGFNYLIKFSNYTHYGKLRWMIIGAIILTYVLNLYFQYELILAEHNLERIGFFEFLKIRLEQGLTIKELNTGWIGLVVSWGLQFTITYYVSIMALIKNLAKIQLERVPSEVMEFAMYLFIKDKTEEQVRAELASKGWSDKQNQDEVLEAIEAMQTMQEVDRIK